MHCRLDQSTLLPTERSRVVTDAENRKHQCVTTVLIYCLNVIHSTPDHTIQKMNTTLSTMSARPRISWVFAGRFIPYFNNGCVLFVRWRRRRVIPTIAITTAISNIPNRTKNNLNAAIEYPYAHRIQMKSCSRRL